MSYPAGRRRKPQCPATIVLDFDSLDCHRPEGHQGMRECTAENGTPIRWRIP